MNINTWTADEVIAYLDLAPHPEGGHYRETYRDPHVDAEGRAASTAIYFLLAEGDRSHWHRVDAAEVWHWYAGAPLALSTAMDGNPFGVMKVLGTDLAAQQQPQIVVPPHVWQSASTLGAWTLVGCTVAPGFSFDGFELAPAGWSPGQR